MIKYKADIGMKTKTFLNSFPLKYKKERKEGELLMVYPVNGMRKKLFNFRLYLH